MWGSGARLLSESGDGSWGRLLSTPSHEPDACDRLLFRARNRGPPIARQAPEPTSISMWIRSPRRRLGEAHVAVAVAEALAPAVLERVDAEGAQARGVLVTED